MPTLTTYLSLCVQYSTSPAPLRVAIKEKLSDAVQLMAVLETLDGWIEQWSEREQTPGKRGFEGDKDGLPPLEKVKCLFSPS